MEGKVIYLTNVDRRFFMMRKACSELKREGLVPAEYETLKVESTSLWSRIWEKQLGDADLVVIRFMGTTIRTMFWDKCLAFLRPSRFHTTWMLRDLRRKRRGTE